MITTAIVESSTGQVPGWSLGFYELDESAFGSDIVEHRHHRHVHLQAVQHGLHVGIHHVGYHPGAFIQLDNGIHVGRIVLEDALGRLVDDGVRVQPAPATDFGPFDLLGETPRTLLPGIEVELIAIGAAGHHQLVSLCCLPERCSEFRVDWPR